MLSYPSQSTTKNGSKTFFVCQCSSSQFTRVEDLDDPDTSKKKPPSRDARARTHPRRSMVLRPSFSVSFHQNDLFTKNSVLIQCLCLFFCMWKNKKIILLSHTYFPISTAQSLLLSVNLPSPFHFYLSISILPSLALALSLSHTHVLSNNVSSYMFVFEYMHSST